MNNIPEGHTQLAIYMGPMWAPIWAVQTGSMWVPYGLAHVNKINGRSRGGSRISCLRVQIYNEGFDFKIVPDNLIVYADFARKSSQKLNNFVPKGGSSEPHESPM